MEVQWRLEPTRCECGFRNYEGIAGCRTISL
jgi:hypothetical protein